MAVSYKPEGYHSVTPYIIVDGAAEAIRWYGKALGATELFRLPMGDKVGHAEIQIGDCHIMLSDEWPDQDIRGPAHRGGASAMFMIYVEDVDAAFARAVAAGGIADKPVENQFYGDRAGTLTDPFGHRWTLATRVEDVSPEEMQRRMDAWSETAQAEGSA
jgi:PhnB protein